MKAVAKMMVDDPRARAHNGSSFDAAYKDKAFVEKICRRIRKSDSLKALRFYLKARRAKDGLGELLGTESVDIGAAAAPPITQPQRPVLFVLSVAEIAPLNG